MIFHNNGLPLKIIGYKESTILQEIEYMFREGAARDKLDMYISVITPEEFIALEDRSKYQYLVMFNQDIKLRHFVISLIEKDNLNCVSAMHHTGWMPTNAYVGKGTVIGPFASLYQHAKIGDHCVIECYSVVGHHSEVGDNCHLRPNTMISGSTTVGNNCMFGARATVLEHNNICDNVVIGALTSVRKDITESGVYIGTSAKRVRDYLEDAG